MLTRFLSNVISSGLGRAFTVAFGILCLFIYARWIPAEEYGGFVLLQVLIGLGLYFSEFGIDTAVTRFIAGTEDPTERRVVVNTGLYFRALCILLISALIFVLQDSVYKLLGGNIPKELLVFLPFMLLIEGLLSFYSYTLEGLLNFKVLAWISFIYGLTSFILTAVLVIPFGLGAYGLVWARLAPKFLCLILTIFATKIPLRLELNWERLRKMIKFGLPLYGNNLLGYGYSRADTIIIGYLLGPAEIAIYEFARRIPESLEMLYNAFKDVYFPFIVNLYASGARDKVASMVNHANRLTCFLGGAATLLAFGLGEWFFRLAFSEQYLSSVPAFGVLMVVLIFIAMDANLGYSLVAIGDSDKPLYINLVRFVVVLACYFLFIPRFNVVGAALSALIGLAVVNPINVFFLRRRALQISATVYLKPLLLLTLGYLALFLFEQKLIITPIVFTVYMAASLLLGALRTEDVQMAYQEAFKIISRLKIGLTKNKTHS